MTARSRAASAGPARGNAPRIYLTIELGRRELENRIFVGLSAVARGLTATLVYHKDPFLFAAPPGLILHKDHGAGSRWDIPQLARNGHRIHALDEEGLIVTDEAVYANHRMHPAVLGVLDTAFTWGERHLARFQSGAVPAVLATGHPKIDVMRAAGRKMRRDEGDILVNTRFPYAIMPPDRFERELGNLRVLGFLKSEADEARFRRTVAGDRRILAAFEELLGLLEAAEMPTRLRPHPAEDREYYERLLHGWHHIRLDDSASLTESFRRARLVVHDGCTTAIEACAFGLPVLGLRPDGLEDPYPDFANRFSANVSGPAALLEMVKSENAAALTVDADARSFIANLSGPLATDRILDRMLETSDLPGPRRRTLPLSPALGWGHMKTRIGLAAGGMPMAGAGRLESTPLGNWARFRAVRERKFATLPFGEGLAAVIREVAALAPERFDGLDWAVRRETDHAMTLHPL